MAKQKISETSVKKQVAQLKKEIAAKRKAAKKQGMNFSGLEEDEIEDKVRGVTSNSPFVLSQTWTPAGAPGSTAIYTVDVRNPDPIDYNSFFATIFFGLGNFYDIDMAWIGRDTRWPEFSAINISLIAMTTVSRTFNFVTPVGTYPGTYLGNCVIWQGRRLGVGRQFDRAFFDMEVI